MKNSTIEKSIVINAPVSTVWRALTDHREFGTWFRVNLEGPFRAGRITRGKMTIPDFAHVEFVAKVEKIQPESYFSYGWHPYAVDEDTDYSKEKRTLVEFELTPKGKGTHLLVRESGFEHIPAARRAEAFRMDSHGWAAQLKNIKRHVTTS